jgi:hypothetical protein
MNTEEETTTCHERLANLYARKNNVLNNFKNIETLDIIQTIPGGCQEKLDAIYNEKKEEGFFIESFKGKKKGKKGGKGKKGKKKGKGKKSKKKKGKKGKKKGTQTKKKRGNSFIEKLGFDKVTSRSLKKAKGWRNLGSIVLFIVPALIFYICGEIVNVDLVRNEKKDKNYAENKVKDKLWLYNSSMEFLSVFVAAYMASAIYSDKFISPPSPMKSPLVAIMSMWDKPNENVNHDRAAYIDKLVDENILIYLLLLPNVIYSYFAKPNKDEQKEEVDVNVDEIKTSFYDIIKSYKAPGSYSGGGGDDSCASIAGKQGGSQTMYSTLYLLSFLFCLFLMKKAANMFLDMFVFKANPLMYMFIVLAFIFWMLNMTAPIKVKTGGETKEVFNFQLFFKVTLVYCLLVFFHLLFSFLLAPLAQGIFILYLAYVFSGGWEFFVEKAKVLVELEIKTSKVEALLGEFLQEKKENVSWMDKFLHDYLLKSNSLMFSMLLSLFFFIKCVLSSVGLKLVRLKWFFSSLNFLGGLIFLFIYSRNSPGPPPPPEESPLSE